MSIQFSPKEEQLRPSFLYQVTKKDLEEAKAPDKKIDPPLEKFLLKPKISKEQIKSKKEESPLARISHQISYNSHALSPHLVPQPGEAVLHEHCPLPSVSQFVATEGRFVQRSGEKRGLAKVTRIKKSSPATICAARALLISACAAALFFYIDNCLSDTSRQ